MRKHYLKGKFSNNILFLNQNPRVGQIIRMEFDRGNYLVKEIVRAGRFNKLIGFWEWISNWDPPATINIIFSVNKKKTYNYRAAKKETTRNGWRKSNLRKHPRV